MGKANRSVAGHFRLICIDPGLNTGFSLLEVTDINKPVTLVDYCTVTYNAAQIVKILNELYYYDMKQLDMTPADFRDLNMVVIEKFVHRPGRPFDPTAYKVMGICEAWHQKFRDGGDPMFEYVERLPVQGKKEAPDDVLKRLGIHLPRHEQRHINDATRHGVSWLLENHHLGTALVGKPKDEND